MAPAHKIGATVNAVLDSPEFSAILQGLADESGTPVAALREEAEADLKEMAVRPGRLSGAVWDRFCAWLSRAYRVDYHPAEVRRLRELNQTASLVFLPNHRSYLDPMILRSALSNHGFRPNNVLGGANLAIWPFSEIGQRNGIVFIRREFRDDHVYRATLRAYLAHLIETRQNLEWYIEGGRTRTGKLRPPRLGILSYVMDAYGDHPERDVLIIPTAVIYDQQHEVGAISAEEMGGSKKPESFKWMYEFATSQSRRLGRAYLRFGEPLSLGDAVALTADEQGEVRPRLAVAKVAFENANRINAATPITPGALLTFALLGNGDRSITQPEGRAILLPLADYIQRRNLPMTEWPDLSEFGSMREVLDRLVSEGVITVYRGGKEPVYAIARASSTRQPSTATRSSTSSSSAPSPSWPRCRPPRATRPTSRRPPGSTRNGSGSCSGSSSSSREPGSSRRRWPRDLLHQPRVAGPHLQPRTACARSWASSTCWWPTG